MERSITQTAFLKPPSEQMIRVAGYARVSSGKDAMLHSLAAQVSHYSDFIQRHHGWSYVGVYADEAKTGTKDSRDNFQRMLADCRAGKIDLIITKSISRFARNTVTLLETVRDLKGLGIDVWFEEQNIHTMSDDGELMLSILASYAQEESRSISENVTWGQRKRFADGKVSMPYKQFLGYEKGEDGTPVINEEEAAIVRLVYKLFLEGKTPAGICRYLEQQSIPTPSGKQKWSQTTVDSILSNEKYKGDALLQKKFTTDFLTKKMKVNEGEVPQYYVEHSHDAIIEPLEWDMVQAEIARRRSLGRAYSGNSVFSSKLVCGDCGGFFGQKVWHSNDSYRKVIWRCNSKFKGESKCATPHLDTETMQRKFLVAYNQLMADRESVISDCVLMRQMLSNAAELNAELDSLNAEIMVVSELVKTCVRENASTAQSQEEYAKKYNGLLARYEKVTTRLAEVTAEKERKHDQDRELRLFIEALKKQPLVLEEWDERLWIAILDRATVFRDGRIVFKFKSGREIEVER